MDRRGKIWVGWATRLAGPVCCQLQEGLAIHTRGPWDWRLDGRRELKLGGELLLTLVPPSQTPAAPATSSSVFSMFGGGAKKEKKVEEDEGRGENSGSAKSQREAAAAAAAEKGEDVSFSIPTENDKC